MRIHEAQIANRAQMYMDSAREAFERGKMRAHGVLELPEYPGGGSTPCLTRCRCEWIYEEVYEGEELVGYNCTWQLDPNADHCEGCLEYEAKWNPLFVSVLGEASPGWHEEG